MASAAAKKEEQKTKNRNKETVDRENQRQIKKHTGVWKSQESREDGKTRR